MIKLTRFVTGLITIVCVIFTVISVFNDDQILTSPYFMTALLFNILQMQLESKLRMEQLSKIVETGSS
ncbi:MAG: hypothetical protein VYD12_14675 [Pseudomonadota bacterium]|nr:hypothetical protein [Pseudomonadota bacterium]